MNKLFAILPATVLSACVSLGAWAQAPAATSATPATAAAPVTPAVAASAPGVKPVEVKPAVVSTVGPAATPPAADKASPATGAATPAAKAKQPTRLHAKAGHKTVHPDSAKAAKASVTSSAAIK